MPEFFVVTVPQSEVDHFYADKQGGGYWEMGRFPAQHVEKIMFQIGDKLVGWAEVLHFNDFGEDVDFDEVHLYDKPLPSPWKPFRGFRYMDKEPEI